MLLKKLFLMLIPILLPGFFLSSITSYAAVDIFDSNRGKPPAKNVPKTKEPKVRPKRKVRKKKVDLVFVGSSHIDSLTLYFKDKHNKQIAVKFNTEKEVFLPGYDDLIIEKMINLLTEKFEVKFNNFHIWRLAFFLSIKSNISDIFSNISSTPALITIFSLLTGCTKLILFECKSNL